MTDLNSIDLETLGRMDADELEALRDDARALLDRIQEQMEWWASPAGRKLHRWTLMPSGLTFYAGAVEDGVLINPALPDGFDCTDNEQRSPEERARWWLRPYIEVDTWEELEKSLRRNQERLQREGSEYAAPDLEAYITKYRAGWFESWPSGSRYDVRCLDGGAWDRPTSWGMFGTLAEALACVNARCQ